MRAIGLGALAVALALGVRAVAAPLPFGPGERVTMRIRYAHLTAGRASLAVLAGEREGRPVLQYVAEARSQGFFAWLFRFRVNDRTVATWDPASGCSLGVEKHLREGRAGRDQVVTFDPAGGIAWVQDPKIKETRLDVGSCVLDVLSALYQARVRGVDEREALALPVFDNGKRYTLGVRFVKRERLDLPPPFGRRVPTVVVEPLLLEGTGLFVKEGRLFLWLTDDARRVPVRMQSKVAIGSVVGELESYEPPAPGPGASNP